MSVSLSTELFDAFDLDAMGKDRPSLPTVEWNDSNEFYGLASQLKDFAGLPQNFPLKSVVCHGYYQQHAWEVDLQAPLPFIMVLDQAQAHYVQSRCNKLAFALGPYIHYARPLLAEPDLAHLRQQLGRTLLVAALHSTHHVDIEVEEDFLLQSLEPLRQDYDSVILLCYWKDILQGRALLAQKVGFVPVSAGHMYDYRFLPRLKSIFQLADAACFFGRGTILPFWAATGKSFCYRNPDAHRSISTAPGHEGDVSPASAYRDEYHRELSRIFHNIQGQDAPEAANFIKKYYGLENLRTATELRTLLLLQESCFQGWKTGQNLPRLAQLGDVFFEQHRHAEAALIYKELALRGQIDKKSLGKQLFCLCRSNAAQSARELAQALQSPCPPCGEKVLALSPAEAFCSSIAEQAEIKPCVQENWVNVCLCPSHSQDLQSLPRHVSSYPALWPLPYEAASFHTLVLHPLCKTKEAFVAMPLLAAKATVICPVPSICVDLPEALKQLIFSAQGDGALIREKLPHMAQLLKADAKACQTLLRSRLLLGALSHGSPNLCLANEAFGFAHLECKCA